MKNIFSASQWISISMIFVFFVLLKAFFCPYSIAVFRLFCFYVFVLRLTIDEQTDAAETTESNSSEENKLLCRFQFFRFAFVRHWTAHVLRSVRHALLVFFLVAVKLSVWIWKTNEKQRRMKTKRARIVRIHIQILRIRNTKSEIFNVPHPMCSLKRPMLELFRRNIFLERKYFFFPTFFVDIFLIVLFSSMKPNAFYGGENRFLSTMAFFASVRICFAIPFRFSFSSFVVYQIIRKTCQFVAHRIVHKLVSAVRICCLSLYLASCTSLFSVELNWQATNDTEGIIGMLFSVFGNVLPECHYSPRHTFNTWHVNSKCDKSNEREQRRKTTCTFWCWDEKRRTRRR